MSETIPQHASPQQTQQPVRANDITLRQHHPLLKNENKPFQYSGCESGPASAKGGYGVTLITITDSSINVKVQNASPTGDIREEQLFTDLLIMTERQGTVIIEDHRDFREPPKRRAVQS